MTQSSNRLLDELAKLMTDAAGVAQGVQREAETMFRSRAEKFLANMDVVQREEFEALREMVIKARSENQQLKKRLDALESGSTGKPAAAKRPRAKPAKSAGADKA